MTTRLSLTTLFAVLVLAVGIIAAGAWAGTRLGIASPNWFDPTPVQDVVIPAGEPGPPIDPNAPRVFWPPFTMTIEVAAPAGPGQPLVLTTRRIQHVSDQEWSAEILSIRDESGRDIQDPGGSYAGATTTFRDGLFTTCSGRFRQCITSDPAPYTPNIATWLDPYRTADLLESGFRITAETPTSRTYVREETVENPPCVIPDAPCPSRPATSLSRETRVYNTTHMLPLEITQELDGVFQGRMRVIDLQIQ